MKTLGILNSDLLYTNLGLILSDEFIHTIKVAVFEDSTNEIFKDRKEFSRSILNQLSEVFDYIKLNNKKHSKYRSL